jgi:hypothetical protein
MRRFESGTFRAVGPLVSGTFHGGTFSDGMLSNGTFRDGTFRMCTPYSPYP